MPKVNANNISIHYQTKGQGPNLVLIHGITSNLALWYFKIFPALTNDFRVIIYDLRGHGYSDITKSGYTSADMADDLNGLLDGLGIEKTHLVGHSFGGLVALHYTALHPEKVLKLVVVDTGIPAVETRKSKSIWDVWADALRGFGIHIEDDKLNDIEYLIQKSKELRQEREKSGKAYKSDLDRFVHLARNTSILNDFRAVAGFTLEKIKDVSNPVMANYGEDSHCMDSCRYLCENLPNCKPLIIPNIGHLHPLEYPQEFVENVKEFLL